MFMSAASPRKPATALDLLALPGDARIEVIDGGLVEKAAPSAEHGDAQLGLGGLLRTSFHRRRDGVGPPGGWWTLSEVDVELAEHDVFRPDLVGWRRERMPARPSGRPIRVRPDWICEILSPSNAKTDRVDKLRVLQRVGVPHYWIVDPERELLTVHRWTESGYVVALSAGRGEVVRAEPFDAIELRVGLLFGDEQEGP
jgi:Uma2 family endonuclease